MCSSNHVFILSEAVYLELTLLKIWISLTGMFWFANYPGSVFPSAIFNKIQRWVICMQTQYILCTINNQGITPMISVVGKVTLDTLLFGSTVSNMVNLYDHCAWLVYSLSH